VISVDPAGLAVVAVLTAAYVRAVRVLGRRGFRVPRAQQATWHAGVGLVAIGLLGPLDSLGEDLLSAHMGQHLLIADLSAPLLLAGMRSPVLFFMLPPRLLAALARQRRLRAASRVLRRPLVALPVYLGVLYLWHLGFAFEGALRNGAVHALQHESFLAAGLLVWWPALEPNRRRLRGELWKAGYVLGMRVGAMFVGTALLILRSPAYDWYEQRGGSHGLTPLADQQIAGATMMSVDVLVMIAALAFFFWRAAEDHDRSERERSRPTAVTAG
jgi:putative copper resistance protein D